MYRQIMQGLQGTVDTFREEKKEKFPSMRMHT
jgi:hypothetical protein